MRGLTEKDREFIKHVKNHCKELGVKCDIRNVSYVKYSSNARCSGWFDSENKKLVVAIKSHDGFSVLVHEYAHITQWQDNIPLWKPTMNSLVRLDEWLSGNEVRNIRKHLSNCRDLELDNEKRSVKLIKEWGLSIDIPDYIKKANAYVMFYNWMYYTRRWSTTKNSPYKNQKVLDVMSPKFNMGYNKMSKKVYKVFSEQNI